MPASFVGNWNCSRYNHLLGSLETLHLSIAEDTSTTLDGYYSQPGRDVTLLGELQSDGKIWRGTLKLPDNTECPFVFHLNEDGSFFGGGWTYPGVEAHPWIGTRIV
jgi:hypothetical protein